MIWLDPRIDDKDFVELVERAGGIVVRDTPEGLYAAVSDDWRGLPHIVQLEAMGLPVLALMEARSQIEDQMRSSLAHPIDDASLVSPDQAPPTDSRREPEMLSKWIGRLHFGGLAIISLVLVITYFAMTPDSGTPSSAGVVDLADFKEGLEVIDALNEINADQAESAPQQQVVNGWTANAYLELIANQNNDLLSTADQTEQSSDRTDALLAVGVVAFAWWGLTHPSSWSAVRREPRIR